MTISFYKGLTRDPEIENTPVLVLANIWRLGQVRNTNCGTNVSNKMLLNAGGEGGYGGWVNIIIYIGLLEMHVMLTNKTDKHIHTSF